MTNMSKLEKKMKNDLSCDMVKFVRNKNVDFI
jgi:hypothetical protein